MAVCQEERTRAIGGGVEEDKHGGRDPVGSERARYAQVSRAAYGRDGACRPGRGSSARLEHHIKD
jgi:hypothetical protein